MGINKRLIKLDHISSLSTEQHEKILYLRNQPEVRKWMYTDHIITQQEHKEWVSAQRQDSRNLVFGVIENDVELVGVVSANSIDYKHKKCDWAFYLSATARGGLGSALELSFINFVFDDLCMRKLNCEVIEGNDPVVKLHSKFGFKVEGFRRSNIVKNGERIGVHFLGLTYDDWVASKLQVYESKKRVFDQFDIRINSPNPK